VLRCSQSGLGPRPIVCADGDNCGITESFRPDYVGVLTGLAVIVAVVIVGVVLLRRPVRESVSWRATVTPLASIIGSGFLVVTPLLAAVVGSWAPLAMVGIVVLAYWVGSAMRFVIVEVEPRLDAESPNRSLVDLERLSRILLGFAYVVSVAFYVRLMASFVLRAGGDGGVAVKLLTTAVLVSIGVTGWLRGLHGLEAFEGVAVGTKLSIIGGLLVGLLVFNASDPSSVLDAYRTHRTFVDPWNSVRVLAGMLLVVQGFETSRYLGAYYDRPLRVESMRRAQLLSAGIYVVFVALSVRSFDVLPATVDETAILDVASAVTPVLVPLLVVAAVASQLSAAVADTAGGGEMLTGATRLIPAAGVGYVAVTGTAIAVVWLFDVFAIVSFASRAFAAYYFVQTVMVMLVLSTSRDISRRRLRFLGFGMLLVVLGFVTVFAIPADS